MTQAGIHHITAISGEPRLTVQFYRDTLGQRLVKRTVNYDDPGTWHLYFGDETGRPGSILTFFPWPGGRRGRIGAGQAAVTSYLVPTGSIGYWTERLGARGIAFEAPVGRFDERVLAFRDPDGLLLELVAAGSEAGGVVNPGSSVPAEFAIQGFRGTTLWTDGAAPATEEVLDTLGFRFLGEEGGRRRFIGTAVTGQVVDLRRVDGFWRGAGGVGTVHHVAFRVPDQAAQLEVRQSVLGIGVQVTPVIDRNYFHSVYFREPGGVLFEVATDEPGFLVDESLADLGSGVMLPPQYESQRDAIVAHLPPLEPGADVAAVPAADGASA